MKSVPWIDNSLKHIFKDINNLRIEEVKEPWDLYLEGYLLETNLGSFEHIEWVRAGKERIFSIRDKNREPLADIVCMPINCNRGDPYWSRLRVFKTSSPMKVDGDEVIVLALVGRREKVVRNPLLEVAKTFFTSHGGEFKEEFPLSVAVKNEHDFRKWQKTCKTYMDWNLCIDYKMSYFDKCQVHCFSAEDSIKALRSGIFDYIYIRCDVPWTKEVMDHLEKTPADRARKDIIFFSNNAELRHSYVQRARQWLEQESFV